MNYDSIKYFPLFFGDCMTAFTFLSSLMGCFESQPQYINIKDENLDSKENPDENIQENRDDNTNTPTAKPDSGSNNSDNSNTKPDYQEPLSEPELSIYSGGYNVHLCFPETQSTGYAVGQVTGDVELIDQYGENLRLSAFCGNTILLIAAAFW